MGHISVSDTQTLDLATWSHRETGTAKLISAFVFATWIVQFLFFLNPKFQVSSLFLIWSELIVNPEDRFSRVAAHICQDTFSDH